MLLSQKNNSESHSSQVCKDTLAQKSQAGLPGLTFFEMHMDEDFQECQILLGDTILLWQLRMTDLSKMVLVTGVAGFLGSYVSKYYHDHGWFVVGIDSSNANKVSAQNVSKYQEIHLPDRSLDDILKAYNFDLCIHCAGRALVNLSVDNPGADFQSNTVVTFDLLNAIRLYSPSCRVVLLSSAAVYGNPKSLPITEKADSKPLSPYGFHKLQCELICEEFSSIYGLQTASARIFSAYGPGLKRQVIWDIFYKALTEPVVKLQGTGDESRDFIHAEDIANAISYIANYASMEGELYNVASSSEVSINTLAELIVSNLTFNGSIEFNGVVPVGVPLNWRSDISKLVNLGFKPTIPLEKGIETFKEWAVSEICKA